MNSIALEMERTGPVATLWLNRPEVHNAFDAQLITELTDAVRSVGQEREVRVVVLAARGRSFCAGAQVQWMQAQGAASPQANAADARRLAVLFQTIAECPKPTIARVQGAALGGGVGLVAACDLAIGTTAAVFATSEVRLGLIPATIGPYVVRAVGERQARRLFLTAERIDAETARQMGLLHIVVEAEQLDNRLREAIESLLAGAPAAQTEAKALLDAIAGKPLTAAVMEDTVQRLSQRRASAEAAEGLQAFLQKRPAAWVFPS